MKSIPAPVLGTLRKLGQDLSDVRKRRRITTALLAERAGILPKTLAKIEKGEPETSIAAYASVMFVLGLLNELTNLADATHDLTGRALEEERLPKRVRTPKQRTEP